ncbi:MAG: hypothetical protein ACJAZN_002151 [Planctomycetota bacterium]
MALVLATSLQAAAALQDEASKLFIVEVEGGYVVDFESGNDREEVSLHELATVAAHATGRMLLWDEATETLLKERRVRLTGRKVVPKDPFLPFFRVLLGTSGFSCRVFGEGDVSVIRIDTL